MAKDYDRYELVKNEDGTIDQLPYVPIPAAASDKYIEWNSSKNRMDKLSQNYYGSPYFDWIILWGNPEFISEFDIPDGTTIRIPFPLNRVIGSYQDEISRYRQI